MLPVIFQISVGTEVHVHIQERNTGHCQCAVWKLTCYRTSSNLSVSLESTTHLVACLPGSQEKPKAVIQNRTLLEPLNGRFPSSLVPFLMGGVL